MAGGHSVEAQQIGALAQPVELEVAVALDARVGGDTVAVGLDIGVDDGRVEVVGEVEHQVIDAQLLGDAAGVVDVGHRAAPGVAFAAPEPHRDAHHLVAGGDQFGRGNR